MLWFIFCVIMNDKRINKKNKIEMKQWQNRIATENKKDGGY